jgi:LysM repeat protein
LHRNIILSVWLISLILAGSGCGARRQATSEGDTPLNVNAQGTPLTAIEQSQTARVTVTISTPAPTPTPLIPSMPLPTPMSPLIDYYQVQPGDTLGGISYTYDIPLEDLLALNGLKDDAILQVGQTIHVPLEVDRTGPLVDLLPDSEVVYSPAYVNFDLKAFIDAQGGFLAGYSQRVNGIPRDGAEVIGLIARQFSVGPRVLLALLEYYSGWVTQPQPISIYPLGPANPYGENLYLQLGWIANKVNEGYYGYKQSGSIPIRFQGGGRAIVPYGMNAGTVGIQNALAVNSDWETWQAEVDPENPTGFMATYRQLFGDPAALRFDPVVPVNLTQPTLQLPWEQGQTFYYTGGPHAAYGDGSAWAAIDFGPPDVLGACFYSDVPVAAVADSRLFLGEKGELYLDLDGDGLLQTGWVILYLHAVVGDNLTQGQMVTAGTPLGYASCEGGIANSSHLHFARRYNGEWLAAGGPVPMVLSGWQVQPGLGQYEGGMIREGKTKTACECWDEEENALIQN